MSIFTIADTHLSFSDDKPMDIFGGWQDYTQRLEANWRALISDEDTVVIPGDISWATLAVSRAGGRDYILLWQLKGLMGSGWRPSCGKRAW